MNHRRKPKTYFLTFFDISKKTSQKKKTLWLWMWLMWVQSIPQLVQQLSKWALYLGNKRYNNLLYMLVLPFLHLPYMLISNLFFTLQHVFDICIVLIEATGLYSNIAHDRWGPGASTSCLDLKHLSSSIVCS